MFCFVLNCALGLEPRTFADLYASPIHLQAESPETAKLPELGFSLPFFCLSSQSARITGATSSYEMNLEVIPTSNHISALPQTTP